MKVKWFPMIVGGTPHLAKVYVRKDRAKTVEIHSYENVVGKFDYMPPVVNKRRFKLFDTEQEAKDWLEKNL